MMGEDKIYAKNGVNKDFKVSQISFLNLKRKTYFT